MKLLSAISAGIALAGCVNGIDCSTSLHLIVSRGSTEAGLIGRIGTVSNGTLALVPGSPVEGVDYPATLSNYTISQGTGVDNLRAAVGAYSTACPDTKIALLGYSQVSSAGEGSWRQNEQD